MILGPEDLTIARLVIDLANFLHAQGRYAEAVPLFMRALPLVEKSSEDPRHLLVLTLEAYAIALREMGRELEAAEAERRASAIRSERLR
jgi:tetratricopeptide (TPR) repeat protein